MNDYDESETSKLSLQVRRPQEGKTGLCINHIVRDTSNSIHLVLTMNTIPSSLQFLGRMKEEICQDRIVIFNSKKDSASGCHYAKDLDTVKDFIIRTVNREQNIKVIVACSHYKRFKKSLPALLTWANDSIQMTHSDIKFVIHIDEAHKYIPENIEIIRSFNDSQFVSEIIGYTATPDGIWSNNASDPLFHKIHICDVDKESKHISDPQYFAVADCEIISHDHVTEDHLLCRFVNITNSEIPIPEIPIPESVKGHYIPTPNMPPLRPTWYHKNSPFALGDELTLLSFIDFTLQELSISSEVFSYNFIPTYTRKVTHYQSMELIHNHYPTSNVIVINGDGFQLFRLCEGTEDDDGKMVSKCINCSNRVNEHVNQIEDEEEQKRMVKALLEPSFMIEHLIKYTRDYPTFVTGYESVGMSVTLVNKSLGNFDNVVMAHQHITRDKKYQLCRFLFNYGRWEDENIRKIKKTKIYTLRRSFTDTCKEYEKHTRNLYMEFAGKSCTRREVMGLDPLEPSDKEIKAANLKLLKLKNSEKIWKKFKVYEGNDDEIWGKAIEFYEGFRGKQISSLSMLKKIDGYYHCTDSKKRGVKTLVDIGVVEKNGKYSRFQLNKDQLKYAKLFVGYDNLNDPSEYTIFLKYIELDDSPENVETLNRYCENTVKDAKSPGDEDQSGSDSESEPEL